MWAQIINTSLGLWLMAAPAALGYTGWPENNDRIVGPFIASFACVAIAQCTRNIRWINAILGLWLIAAPLVLGHPADAAINSILVGILVIALSLVRGRITHRFGGGWSIIWKKNGCGVLLEDAPAPPAQRSTES